MQGVYRDDPPGNRDILQKRLDGGDFAALVVKAMACNRQTGFMFDQGCRFVVTLTVAVRAPYTLAVGGDSGADTKPWRRETLQHRLNLCRIRHLQNPVQNRFRRRLESPSLFIAPRTECFQFRLVQGAGVLRRANAACDASKPRGDEDSKHRCNGVLAALSAAEVRNPQQFVIERA